MKRRELTVFTKRKMSPKEKTEERWAWLFVAPTILGLIILNFYPIFQTVYQSFCKTGDFGKGNIFIGLRNYQTVMQAA